jgi:hypothetical protein
MDIQNMETTGVIEILRRTESASWSVSSETCKPFCRKTRQCGPWHGQGMLVDHNPAQYLHRVFHKRSF